jgi:two-component system sensor histidine kinase ChiS
MRVLSILFIFFSLFCCTPEKADVHSVHSQAAKKIRPVLGDQIIPPTIVKPAQNRQLRFQKPVAFPIPVFSHSLDIQSQPETHQEPAIVMRPGVDGVPLPKVVIPSKKYTLASPGEQVKVKDPSAKENNPFNFTFYKVLQGLPQSTVRSAFEDKKGNLWFGTYSGGVSKFNGKTFTNYSTAQGLNNNVVFSICQDNNENMWFGTGGGATFYDGNVFEHYTEEGGFCGNTVNSICKGDSGRIWFGTTNGVAVLAGKHLKIFRVDQGLPDNFVFKVFRGKNGRMWFGTANGLCCFDGQDLTSYTTDQGLCNNVVLSIEEDANGLLWIGTVNGVSTFDGKYFSTIASEESLRKNVFYSIYRDSRDKLWFGTMKGMLQLDGNELTRYTEEEGLSNNIVFCILEDRGGSIWMGTSGGGVVHFGGKAMHYYTRSAGLQENVVLAICQDKEKNIWFGTNGGGATRFDGKTIVNFSSNNGLPGDIIYDIKQDQQDNIWFATDTRGVCCYNGDSFTYYGAEDGLGHSSVFNMLCDRKGTMWFATDGAGVARFDGRAFTQFSRDQGLAENTVYCVYEDSRGNLWFGTSGGVSKYDGKRFFNFTKKEGLPSTFVFSVLEDSKGNLWFGTNRGACRYDGKTLSILTEKDGLSNNSVLSMVEDEKGDVWFGTRKGLSRLKASFNNNFERQVKLFSEENPFYVYGYDDGFLGLNCRRNSVLKDATGNLWWGSDLLAKLTPSELQVDSAPPQMDITNLKLFGKALDWAKLGRLTVNTGSGNTTQRTFADTMLSKNIHLNDMRFAGLTRWYNLPEKLSLPYDVNYVSFDFDATHIQDRNHLRFRFMLEGLDEDWNLSREETQAHYGNLSPGKYTFKVMAMNQSGKWSTPSEYTFEIRPAFWQTWWFRTLVLLVIILLIVIYVRWREMEAKEVNEKLEKKNRELVKINAELDRFVYSASHELRAPLASVIGLIHLTKSDLTGQAQIQKVEMMESAVKKLDAVIHDIVDYSKNARLEMKTESIDMNDILNAGIERCSHLPGFHQIRFINEIKAQTLFFSDRDRVTVLFNNLISNAVKFSNLLKGDCVIAITVEVNESQLIANVKDNGVGIAPAYLDKIFEMFFRGENPNAGAGLGLYICQEIVQRLSGSLTVESVPNKGTEFHIILPNLTKKKREKVLV